MLINPSREWAVLINTLHPLKIQELSVKKINVMFSAISTPWRKEKSQHCFPIITRHLQADQTAKITWKCKVGMK